VVSIVADTLRPMSVRRGTQVLGIVITAMAVVVGVSPTAAIAQDTPPASPVIGLGTFHGSQLSIALTSAEPAAGATYQWTLNGVTEAATDQPTPLVISSVTSARSLSLSATETLEGVTSAPGSLVLTLVHYIRSGKSHLIGNDMEEAGLNLTHVNLAGVNLSATDLTGANLTTADLAGANLDVANLTSASGDLTDFSSSTMSGAILSRANLFGAHFVNADLRGVDGPAIFVGTVGLNAWFTHANLAGVTMTSCNFSAANFVHADLDGATFVNSMFVLAEFLQAAMADSTFTDVDFRGDNLMWTDLTGATFTDSSSDFEHANFSNATMHHANLSDLQLTDAIFKQVRLVDATATDAVMVHDYLGWANLRGSTFVGANVTRAIWKETICPNGHNSGSRGRCHGQGGGL
jgi:uncharacterized protein YjbI with pentapeptide repeats